MQFSHLTALYWYNVAIYTSHTSLVIIHENTIFYDWVSEGRMEK